MKPTDSTRKISSTETVSSSDKKKSKFEKSGGGSPKAKTFSSEPSVKGSKLPVKSETSRQVSSMKNPDNTVVPIKDVFRFVAKELTWEDKQELRTVSKNTKELVTTDEFVKIEMDAKDLAGPVKNLWGKIMEHLAPQTRPQYEKPDFALASNLKITIKISNSLEDIKKLNEFITNPNNQKFLGNIDKIIIEQEKTTSGENVDLIQDLLNNISEKSNEFKGLTTININVIKGASSSVDVIDIPKKLPSNLKSLSFNTLLRAKLNIPEKFPAKLESFSVKEIIYSKINFQKELSAPALKTIDFGRVDDSEINLPEKIPDGKCGISFGSIGSLTETDKNSINFPETLGSYITNLSYGNIDNPEIKKQLDERKAAIDAS